MDLEEHLRRSSIRGQLVEASSPLSRLNLSQRLHPIINDESDLGLIVATRPQPIPHRPPVPYRRPNANPTRSKARARSGNPSEIVAQTMSGMTWSS